MKMKTWQILVLLGGGLATLCLVCIAAGLFIDLALPESTAAEPASLAFEPATVAPALSIPTEAPVEPPPSPTAADTPTFVPSATPLPSLTPVPIEAFSGFAFCIPDNPRESGIVSKVIDGDTIEVVIREVPKKVRYIGIDTPELRGEPYALEAAQFNRTLVEGKLVTLVKDVNETDRYERLLRYVLVNGLFVNYELVKQGYAYAKDYPPDTACSLVLRAAEAEAQTAGRALWSQAAAPIAPILPSPASRFGGDNAPCNCAGPDLNCPDFQTQAQAQACWNSCRTLTNPNPFRLDGDGNGLVCEALP